MILITQFHLMYLRPGQISTLQAWFYSVSCFFLFFSSIHQLCICTLDKGQVVDPSAKRKELSVTRIFTLASCIMDLALETLGGKRNGTRFSVCFFFHFHALYLFLLSQSAVCLSYSFSFATGGRSNISPEQHDSNKLAWRAPHRLALDPKHALNMLRIQWMNYVLVPLNKCLISLVRRRTSFLYFVFGVGIIK